MDSSLKTGLDTLLEAVGVSAMINDDDETEADDELLNNRRRKVNEYMNNIDNSSFTSDKRQRVPSSRLQNADLGADDILKSKKIKKVMENILPSGKEKIANTAKEILMSMSFNKSDSNLNNDNFNVTYADEMTDYAKLRSSSNVNHKLNNTTISKSRNKHMSQDGNSSDDPLKKIRFSTTGVYYYSKSNQLDVMLDPLSDSDIEDDGSDRDSKAIKRHDNITARIVAHEERVFKVCLDELNNNKGFIRYPEAYKTVIDDNNRNLQYSSGHNKELMDNGEFQANVDNKNTWKPMKKLSNEDSIREYRNHLAWAHNSGYIDDEVIDCYLRVAIKCVKRLKAEYIIHRNPEIDNSIIDGKLVIMKSNVVEILLDILHYCNYDAAIAIEQVNLSGDRFMVIWTPEEQRIVRKVYSQFHDNISKMAEVLPKKSRAEIVDYFHRYIEANRRFEDQGKITETIPKSKAMSLASVPVMLKKTRSINKQRNAALTFVVKLRQKLDDMAFGAVMNAFLQYSKRNITLPQLVMLLRESLTTSLYTGIGSGREVEVSVDGLYTEFVALLPDRFLELLVKTLPHT
jgi:hypothetical protein